MFVFSGQTGLPSGSLAWYVEGFLAPVIYLRRGLTYTFKVEGGNNPRSAEFYHPFIITDEPVGGYYRSSQCLRVGLSSPPCSGCRRSRGQRSECWRGSSSPGDTSPTLWTTWAGTESVMARTVTAESVMTGSVCGSTVRVATGGGMTSSKHSASSGTASASAARRTASPRCCR